MEYNIFDTDYTQQQQQKLIDDRNLFNVKSKIEYGASALATLFQPDINYDKLVGNAKQAEQQADNIEAQAMEQADLMRQQLNEYLGDAVYTSARRGVKVNEGSAKDHVELSSKAMGEDESTMFKNADKKAEEYRTMADEYRKSAKAQQESTMIKNAITVGMMFL